MRAWCQRKRRHLNQAHCDDPYFATAGPESDARPRHTQEEKTRMHHLALIAVVVVVVAVVAVAIWWVAFRKKPAA